MQVKFGDKNKTADFLKILIKLKEKGLRIINFKNFNENANPLFKENKFLKISSFIAYKNALFVRKLHKKEYLYLFHDMFTLLNTNHDYNTRAGSKNLLDTPSQSRNYGENSIKIAMSTSASVLSANSFH